MTIEPKTDTIGTNRNDKGQILSDNGPKARAGPLQPRSDVVAQQEARKLAPEALERLKTVMRSHKSPATAKVAAANAILDRAYGKPAQALELGNKDGEAFRTAQTERLGRMTDDQLETEISRIEQRMEAESVKRKMVGLEADMVVAAQAADKAIDDAAH